MTKLKHLRKTKKQVLVTSIALSVIASGVIPFQTDVVNKSIAQMQQDMISGTTTSVQITQAYLDRIKAYDWGQLGFHAYLHVSETALAQA
ncbi:hypothetical protein NST04_24645 [Paenibacillus sp. FSL H7-0756]|uniref:hypothetical protein n=1 Tax=Paenibacillus sp. FSL H7-0756 TaxID=2954738 RepID=UPI0030F82956